MNEFKSYFLNATFVILCVNLQLLLLTDASSIRMTKIECIVFDKSFLSFKSCYLKVLGRNKIGGNVYVRLLKPPVDNIMVNCGFYVKSSSQKYNPLLYNNTLNFCSFFKNPNQHMFWKLVAQYIGEYSNINHSCPYNHDLIVSNLVISMDLFKFVPFPTGDYLVKLRAGVLNDYKGEVLIYMNLKE